MEPQKVKGTMRKSPRRATLSFTSVAIVEEVDEMEKKRWIFKDDEKKLVPTSLVRQYLSEGWSTGLPESMRKKMLPTLLLFS
jgi:hypothetical protein